MAFNNARKVALAAGRKRAMLKAQELRTAVIKHAPVDTGRLRQGIGVKQISDTVIRVGTNVEYAPYVEFGTRFQAPAAMFRKGVREVFGQ